DRFEIMNYATEVKGSLAEKFPEVAKERHATKNGNLKPSYFKPRSDFKVWWKCSECGNEYEATIGHRTYGTGCPKCGIKKSALKRRNVST
ncbi:MAG: zinc-ribbon domain-containing protein, partial [Bacilli bacterium]|nr:zinc-ribbon domain-containing protein [Bacilli bacterium]